MSGGLERRGGIPLSAWNKDFLNFPRTRVRVVHPFVSRLHSEAAHSAPKLQLSPTHGSSWSG